MLFKNAVNPACYAILKDLFAGNIIPGFALAGDTSLALRMGHRVSIDLDFFSEHSFNSEELLNKVTRQFPAHTVLMLEQNTLNMMIEDIKVQFLGHLYPVLEPYEQVDGVKHYSFEDITAMKLNAIAGRGDKKDFWDFNFLLEKFPAVQALGFFKAKYQQFDVAHVVKSLSYFNDAELQPDPKIITAIDWKTVKANILKAEREIVNHYKTLD